MGRIEVPPSWKNLTFSGLDGVILIVGATDTGKTTFARYAYRRLRAHHERVAFVDGDVGQASLGPPTTMTVALGTPDDERYPPQGPRHRAFVGDISPAGHMLQTLVAADRTVRKARDAGATAIVFDTTGLVAAAKGGGALKLALVDLLRAEVVVGLQRRSELEHLLVPLRCSQRTRVIDREVPSAVQRRDKQARREHRAAQYRRTFAGARSLRVQWSGMAVLPAPSFTCHRLVAFEDQDGSVLELGIVTGREEAGRVVKVRTRLSSLDGVDSIRVGDVAVNPKTFQDERL